MKKLILTLGIAVASYFSYAQNTYPWPSTGNIGIGTISPTNKLEVDGGASEVAVRISTTNTGASAASLILANSSKTAFNDGLQVIHGAGVTKFNDLAGTNLMSLDLTYGKVGIGTNNPLTRLQVQGTGGVQGANNDVMTIVSEGAYTGGPTINTTVGLNFNMNQQPSGGSGAAGWTYGAIRAGEDTGMGAIQGSLRFLTQQYSGGSVLTERMRISSNGNIGIGTTSPSSSLDVFHNGTGSTLRVGGNSTGTSNDASIDLYVNNANNTPVYGRIALGVNTGTIGSETGYLNFSTINSGALTEKMRLTASGNVLIGQTSQNNPSYKLDINGTARAKEIVVNSDGADFVFEPKYALPTLTDVKNFIDKHHHLPEIPSAAEMQKNGMSIGELNTKLLQKIEELTLYAIDQHKRIDQLEEEQEKSKQQDARIATLEKALLKLIDNK